MTNQKFCNSNYFSWQQKVSQLGSQANKIKFEKSTY